MFFYSISITAVTIDGDQPTKKDIIGHKCECNRVPSLSWTDGTVIRLNRGEIRLNISNREYSSDYILVAIKY